MTGLKGIGVVFTSPGTVPDTLGEDALVVNPNDLVLIDRKGL